MSLVRKLTRMAHVADHSLSRLSPRRRVLVEMRTPVYHAVLGPMCETLERWPNVVVEYTSEDPERIRPLIGKSRFLTHGEAEWRRYDLYLNADPWSAARLRRCAHRINFFHGVAGKYDLDNPGGLPMGLEYYDRVAFINADRMRRYVAARAVTPAQAVLVGYPKLDLLASGSVDGRAVRETLGLWESRSTVLYAPTYSSASSLHLAGEDIVRGLDAAGFNVIVKLHDRSLDSDPRYTANIDWRARMQALDVRGRIKYVEGPNACPYLAAADLMVTDHSSVGFEFLVLDRPLLVFEAPGLVEAARINPEKVSLLRSAARVVSTVEELVAAASEESASPGRLSIQRRRVAGEVFYQPGGATKRAVALIRELLGEGLLPQGISASERAPVAEGGP